MEKKKSSYKDVCNKLLLMLCLNNTRLYMHMCVYVCVHIFVCMYVYIYIFCGEEWHPTPVFLPGESQGWGSLVGCRLWGRTESDKTEAT